MSIVPYLTIAGGRGAEAADYYIKLFDAQQGMRMQAEDGQRLMHCVLQFAGSTLYLCDDFGEPPQTTPAMCAVFVGCEKPAAVDALIAKARGMGATITHEPQDMFWGDRFAMFTDPFGHHWQAGAPKG